MARVIAREKLKEGGGVDRIYLLPKYFAMHIWLNISFSRHTERRGGFEKSRVTPPCFPALAKTLVAFDNHHSSQISFNHH